MLSGPEEIHQTSYESFCRCLNHSWIILWKCVNMCNVIYLLAYFRPPLIHPYIELYSVPLVAPYACPFLFPPYWYMIQLQAYLFSKLPSHSQQVTDRLYTGTIRIMKRSCFLCYVLQQCSSSFCYNMCMGIAVWRKDHGNCWILGHGLYIHIDFLFNDYS